MQPLGVEFQIIKQYFETRALEKSVGDTGVILGIGDDCAILSHSPNCQLAISVDTSIAGRHFPEDANPYDIAYRALNVSLSDLAAMGATAKWFTLALTIPNFDKEWLEQFSAGLFQSANNAAVLLIGGDTTKGTLSITIQVHGELPMGKALKRSGAKVGDTIYVSGTLGDAGAGLAIYQNSLAANQYSNELLTAYLKPEPELLLGLQLRDIAHSCIDISDGLLSDLSHILRASDVGAELDLHRIPLSKALLFSMNKDEALQLALTAGDDYKLCFTSDLPISEIGLANITAIGKITADKELILKNLPTNFSIIKTGFDHFHE